MQTVINVWIIGILIMLPFEINQASKYKTPLWHAISDAVFWIFFIPHPIGLIYTTLTGEKK